jgi:polyisoprenoid-binding protein YceI
MGFRSTRIELVEDGTASVDGVLEIRGVERPVRAAGTFAPPTEDPSGRTRLGFALAGTIDRRSWGMDWQLPLPAGGDALAWEVEITAHLELTRDA